MARYSIAFIAIVAAFAAGGALYFVKNSQERQVLEVRKHLEQAQAQRAAMEAAAAQAKAMAEQAGAERAGAEKAAAEAKAFVERLAVQRAAAEKAVAEARATIERLAIERVVAEKAASEAGAMLEKAAAERAAAERRATDARATYEERLAPPPGPEVLYERAAALEAAGKNREAVALYTRAARNGSGKAAKRLGEIYDKGIPGVSRDYPESLKWFNAARVLGEDVPIWKSR